MKRYVEKSNCWKNAKALEYFANFIRFHRGSVNDRDTFAPVADLVDSSELQELIREYFPAKTITRMENLSSRRDRLDFDDDPREIIREIWCADFARTRLLKMLAAIIDREREAHPVAKYADEPFARRCAELQKTLSLSDFELDVMLVLAFVNVNLLCIAVIIKRSILMKKNPYSNVVFAGTRDYEEAMARAEQ